MPKFIDNTDSTFEAPSGSPADIAEDSKFMYAFFITSAYGVMPVSCVCPVMMNSSSNPLV